MKKIAITGGLSCGKSTVGRLLEKQGAYFVSADEIIHQLLFPESTIGKQIVQLLGKEILDGEVFDRKQIARKVFSNKEFLKALEHILHPALLEEIEERYAQIKNDPSCLFFVAEIPLLYEIESQHLFDFVIAVISDPQIATERFQHKTTLPEEEFERRMTHQLPPADKSAKADFTITNNGDMEDLETQVATLLQTINP